MYERAIRRALIGAAALVLVSAPSPASAATVSLSGWKLTLPVNSAGQQSGASTTLDPAAVDPPWLVRNTNGSLTFWAPTKGAHTPNSLHPRTELVRKTDFTAGSGNHSMSATFEMQKLPAANDIIIGQIHCGGADSSIPLLMLHYKHTSSDAANSGRIYLVVRTNPDVAGTDTATILTGVPMNAAFSYTITANGGSLTVSATSGSQSGNSTKALNSSFKGKDVRWQVGDYQQSDANDSSTDGGRLTVDALSSN
jgi:hypothetical protein